RSAESVARARGRPEKGVRGRRSEGAQRERLVRVCASFGLPPLPTLAGTWYHEAISPALSCFEAQGIVASGGEGGDERLAGQVANDRRDEPAQSGGDVARQRHGLALDVHAAVALFEAPVGIKPPEESVILSNRQFVLAGTAG